MLYAATRLCPPFVKSISACVEINGRFGDIGGRVYWSAVLTKVSEYFLMSHRTASDISFIPLELNHFNRDSLRKARDRRYLISRGNNFQPLGFK